MREIQALAKQLGRNHESADALWASSWYEARLLAAYVDDPALVTPAQMDRWSRDFDNWGVCDTVCFALFDRTPHAWTKVETWATRRAEFVKRAAFALLWGLTVHDKTPDDRPFLRGLELIEQAATDDRHFLTKAVDMALRAVGSRNGTLHAAAIAAARRLSTSTDAAAVRVGKHALRELAKKRPTQGMSARANRLSPPSDASMLARLPLRAAPGTFTRNIVHGESGCVRGVSSSPRCASRRPS